MQDHVKKFNPPPAPLKDIPIVGQPEKVVKDALGRVLQPGDLIQLPHNAYVVFAVKSIRPVPPPADLPPGTPMLMEIVVYAQLPFHAAAGQVCQEFIRIATATERDGGSLQ